MGLQETYQQTQAALGGTGPMLPPGANPLVPPEAYAAPAPAAIPQGFEMGPVGLRPLAPPGYQYNAAGGVELIPPAPVAVALPPAPPPIPDAPPAIEATKGKGKGKAKKVEDVLDLIFAAAKNNRHLESLTVAQLDAIREVVEAA